jgi:hypothetical protein
MKHPYFANEVSFLLSSTLQFTHIRRPPPPSQHSVLLALQSLLFSSDIPPLGFRPPLSKIRWLLAASFWPRGRHWLTRCRCLVRNGALLLVVLRLLVAMRSVLSPPVVPLCLGQGLLFAQCLPLGRRLPLLLLLLPRLPLLLCVQHLGLRPLPVLWRWVRSVPSLPPARPDRLLLLQLPLLRLMLPA